MGQCRSGLKFGGQNQTLQSRFDHELRCRSKNWRVMNEYYVLSHVAAELCRDDLTEAAQKVPLFDQRTSECQITGSNDGGL